MPHPNGGRGNYFNPKHTFDEAYHFVGNRAFTFFSTTGEKITATRGTTKDGNTDTIVFDGVKSRHGNVCHACWGYRSNCSRTRIGQCTETLDKIIL